MNIKISALLALSAVVLQLLVTLSYSDLAFTTILMQQIWGLLITGIVIFGTCYGLLKVVYSQTTADFDNLLHKLANEDGSFDDDIRQFIKPSLKDKTPNSNLINLSRIIARLVNIIDEVNEAAGQLAENSNRAISVAHKTSEGIIKQYDESNTVETTTQDISRAIREVADNSNAAANAAKQVGSDADAGQIVIEDVINSINELAEDVNMAVPVIESLAKQSEQIGSIVSVISDISDQTNLLALNAAIEAARAGEAGRGFAVVADEVRDLSRRTAEATMDIQEMISKLQEGSQQAVTSIIKGKDKADESAGKALKGRESLQQITSAVSTITDMSVQTATAVEEQSASTENINQGIKNLSSMIDESSKHSEESAAAAQEQTLMVDYIQANLNLKNSVVDARTIKLYSYQNMPPYVTEPGKGLTYDLANYLTKKMKGAYKFVVFRLPRSRADKLIDKGVRGLVPWTAPAWHGDPDESKYVWSAGYSSDANCIISSASTPFEYDGPDSMKGKTMGGLIGYFYLNLDDLSNKGEFTRVDVSNVRENIKRLLTNRIDSALVTESTARYLVGEQMIKEKIHFSTKKHQEFNYQILSIANEDALNGKLIEVTKNMLSDPEWQAEVSKYQ